MNKNTFALLKSMVLIQIILPLVPTLLLFLVHTLIKNSFAFIDNILVLLIFIDVFKPIISLFIFTSYISKFESSHTLIKKSKNNIRSVFKSILVSGIIFLVHISSVLLTLGLPYVQDTDKSGMIIYMMTFLLMILFIPIQFVILTKTLNKTLD